MLQYLQIIYYYAKSKIKNKLIWSNRSTHNTSWKSFKGRDKTKENFELIFHKFVGLVVHRIHILPPPLTIQVTVCPQIDRIGTFNV